MSEKNETQGNGTEEKVDEITEDVIIDYDCDSSSVQDITTIMVEDEGDLLGDSGVYDEVKKFLDETAKDDSKTDQEIVDAGVEVLRDFCSQTNKSQHTIDGNFTQYAIQQGQILNTLKRHVQSLDEQWEPWAAENIPFMGERTRQQYMLIARRTDAHKYAFLGKERLLLLISATKPREKNDDPIGDLLTRFEIPFDPKSEAPIAEYKVDVDAALAMMKIGRVGLEKELDLDVRFDLIKKLIGVGRKIDSGIIDDLVIIKKSGGDVNKYLTDRYLKGGKEEKTITSARVVTGFPKLVAEVKSTVDYIKENTELVTQIHESQIKALEAHISELKELIANN